MHECNVFRNVSLIVTLRTDGHVITYTLGQELQVVDAGATNIFSL